MQASALQRPIGRSGVVERHTHSVHASGHAFKQTSELRQALAAVCTPKQTSARHSHCKDTHIKWSAHNEVVIGTRIWRVADAVTKLSSNALHEPYGDSRVQRVWRFCSHLACGYAHRGTAGFTHENSRPLSAAAQGTGK